VRAVTECSNGGLLAVGNRGLAGTAGRLPASVPAGAARRSECDVLVVHTTG
jgi:nucleotide-binding universal stress UspA family protein